MALTITNLDVRSRATENWFGTTDCPYLIVNCTFKVDRDDNFTFERAKAEAEEYHQVLTIDDPERYEAWIVDPNGWDFSSRYDGYGRAWTHNECPWRYIKKFDTFWFREWIADCRVTRAVIQDLAYYRDLGKFQDVYRTIEPEIVLQHLRTLQGYWD